MRVSEEVFEVSLFWGERLLDVRMAPARHAPRWSALPADAASAFVGSDEGSTAPLWRDEEGEWRLTHPARDHTVRLSGEREATMRSGNLSLVVRPAQRPAAVKGSFLKDRDYAFFKLASVTGMSAVALVLMLLLPPTVDAASDPLFRASPDLLIGQPFTLPKPPVKPVFKDEVAKIDDAQPPDAATARRRDTASTGGGGPSRVTDVRDRGLLAIMGGSGGMKAVLGGDGLDRAVAVLDGLTGSGAQTAEVGTGGLTSRGPGPGSGGPGGGGVGVSIGGAGTRFGRGPGSGDGIGPGLKAHKNVVVTRPPKIIGGLDRSEIARVIRQHAAAIRACYETGLSQEPDLAGKVAVTFVIDPSGGVQQADVAETSLESALVEACMLQRIRTWRFPEPRGGGQVTVNFPWIFRPAGSGD